MRLATFWMGEQVKHVGILYLMGAFERGGFTVVNFLLQIRDDAPLAEYFAPQYGFPRDSLLSSIFEGEGIKVCEPVTKDGKRFLIFFREVEGVLRDPPMFLHATTCKLFRELQTVEEQELAIQETSDQLEWCEHDMMHPGRRGPMPDFSRPRHN